MVTECLKLDGTAAEALEALAQKVRDFPALPGTVVRVTQMTDDPKCGVSDIAKVLVSDQALAARVLKLANSAFYGSSRRVATVSDAVVILGMRTTRNLVMATGCQEMLEDEISGYALPRGAMLRHSLACASAAQALAKRTRFRGTEEAFVAGLLHDLGKVIMNTYFRDRFIQALIQVAGGERTYAEAEQAAFGFDHAEAGAYLLERWSLPAALVAAVRYHHRPLDAPTESPLPCLVHIADAICMTLGVGLGLDGLAYRLQPEALAKLELTAADFEEVAGETCDMLTQAEPVL